MNIYSLYIPILLIIVIIILLFLFISYKKSNLIKDSLEAVTIVNTKFWKDLSKNLSIKHKDRDAKILAGAISNIIFSQEHVPEEQKTFVDNNLELIEKEIRVLKKDKELCEMLRQAVIIDVIMRYIKKRRRICFF